MGRARGVSRADVSQDVRRRKAESGPANTTRVHNRRSVIAPRGLVTAPHGLATTSGLRVLQEGGNAIEAAIAAAATIAVVYPHMNAIGGDNFWLIHDAVHYAESGCPVTPGQEAWTRAGIGPDSGPFGHLETLEGFRRTFLRPDGSVYPAGARFVMPGLGRTLAAIGREGPDAFYR